MPVTIVDSRGGFVRMRMEQSPNVMLETDADSADSIPLAVQAAFNSSQPATLNGFRSRAVPRGADAVLTWLAGETILSGSPAAIRYDLQVPGRCTYVPVHVPCLEEVSLLTIQPRWFRSGDQQNRWNPHFRIQSTSCVSPLVMEALAENREPWAELSFGVMAENARTGAGVEILVKLWERAGQLPPFLAALVLRNLAVLMLRHGETTKAEHFLQAGMRLYPAFAELSYLAAWHAIGQQRAGQALPLLEQARSHDTGGFLGSGGENSYRVDWLMGRLAAHVGDERTAFRYFLSGLKSEPIFVPAVNELLKLRVSQSLIETHQRDFCRAARRQPELTQKISDYLVLHRALDAAQHIARTISIDEANRSELEQRLALAPSTLLKDHRVCSMKPGVDLIGPFFEHSSLARINREIAGALLNHDGLHAVLEPSAPNAVLPRMFPGGTRLQAALFHCSSRPALTIRHRWPPDFRRPSTGKLAAIVPWEYGTVPRVWVTQIESNVDELWVPSRFVRDVFVRGGVTRERVRVIPNGIDTTLFSPEGPVSRPAGSRKFMFLFVGGAIRRKGADLLMEAFKAAFDPGEDVSLLLVASGSAGAYQHNSLLRKIQLDANHLHVPHVQVITDSVNDGTLAALYRGCDALVLPYRGEGFGMPLLEAMACGKPVITTAKGPSLDFCSRETAYLVDAHEEEVTDEPPPLGELTGPLTWFEPSFSELARTLRHVYEHREETAQRGRSAAPAVRHRFAWPRITQMYVERVNLLTQQ